MTREYDDAINPEAMQAAVRLTLSLRQDGGEPLADLAERAVLATFCACVTGAEDAAEERVSQIHTELVTEVRARAAARLDGRPHTTCCPAAAEPDRGR